MQDDNRKSRINKFEKRRKNTKQISILMVTAGLLLLILLVFWFLGGKDKDGSDPDHDVVEDIHIEEKNNDVNESEHINEDGNNTANQDDEDLEPDMVEDVESNENREDSDSEDNAEVEPEQIESSDDNVIEAYTANWQPVGTIQEGPHTTNYDNGSQDRIEIKLAVMSATGLGEDLTEHWVGNGGDQKVVATVANPGNTEIYRVYLSWIDQEGWQVTQIERLKEVKK